MFVYLLREARALDTSKIDIGREERPRKRDMGRQKKNEEEKTCNIYAVYVSD